MKYKLGDKVRVVGNNHRHQFNIGALVEITDVGKDDYECYGIDNSGNKNTWYVSEEDIISIDYTWEDFLKAPIGTKVTFENGEYLLKFDKDEFEDEFANLCDNYSYEAIESFETKLSDYGKVIKIEEPTYMTVYEPQEVTMPEIEEMKRLTDELCKTCDEFIKKIKEK